MDYYKIFLEVIDALEKEKVEYALSGGFAIITYGLSNRTKNMDLFVKLDEENIAKLKKVLLSIFTDESINDVTPGLLKDYPVIRYEPPGGFYIDIMSRIGDEIRFEDLKIETKAIDGHPVRISSVESPKSNNKSVSTT
jgi:hypothetical protein